MTERIEIMEGSVPLRPGDTQGRHGVTEGKPVMPPADQPPVLDAPFADPKFSGNDGRWPGY